MEAAFQACLEKRSTSREAWFIVSVFLRKNIEYLGKCLVRSELWSVL